MTDWLTLSERSKRVLHIMMVRTHRPLTLKAGFLMTLSLSTYVAVGISKINLSFNIKELYFNYIGYKNNNLQF